VSRKPITNPLLDNDGYIDPVNLINPYSFAAAGAFDPLSITGCVLWLKADGNVYNTGTTQATNGQTVETWVDASTSAASVTQSTSGYRPLFQTSVVNGKPVLRFDGTDDYFPLLTDVLSGAGGATLLAVVKQVYDPPTVQAAAGHFMGAVGTDSAIDVNWVDGNIYNGFASATRKSTGDPTANLTGWRVVSIRSASTWEYFIDGAQHYSAASSVGIKASSPYALIGASSVTGLTYNFEGDIAEIVLYDNAISDPDLEAAEDGLGDKYGVTITH
jgi:hypothetical protein